MCAGRRGDMNMDKTTALSLVQEQLDLLRSFRDASVGPGFDRWHRDTRVVLERVFGKGSDQTEEFSGIRFTPMILTDEETRQRVLDSEAFSKGVSQCTALLESIISEIERFWDDNGETGDASLGPLERVLVLCERLAQVARQLQSRHDDRGTIQIKDEYDVQDLLHALLRIDFDDIRPEEWAPSYAGGSARMDFLLKDHQLVIEVKKTRKGLGVRQVGDELLVDIARYRTHSECKTLVCFVYDCERLIQNPAGLQKDLSREEDGLKVIAVVSSG